MPNTPTKRVKTKEEEASDRQLARLIGNVHLTCERIVLGKAAFHNWYVKWQRTLVFASIALSTLGSFGVIDDKAGGKLLGQTGLAFWGSIVLLFFGIISQAANEFQVSKNATHSRTLSSKCYAFEHELRSLMLLEDPSASVSDLTLKVQGVIIEREYIVLIPKELTDKMKADARTLADGMIGENPGHWRLKIRSRGKVNPRATPPTPPEDISEGTSDDH